MWDLSVPTCPPSYTLSYIYICIFVVLPGFGCISLFEFAATARKRSRKKAIIACSSCATRLDAVSSSTTRRDAYTRVIDSLGIRKQKLRLRVIHATHRECSARWFIYGNQRGSSNIRRFRDTKLESDTVIELAQMSKSCVTSFLLPVHPLNVLLNIRTSCINTLKKIWCAQLKCLVRDTIK